jgi:hypothetical protein
MPALEPQYMSILKKILNDIFVPLLPPLLDTTKPAEAQLEKQLSRAFSAFALHKMLGASPQIAAQAVVDDFDDKGIDAIYYEAHTETLYVLQTKLKASEQFKQGDALPFCEGVRLLLKQDFTAFNKNFLNRQLEIEQALDNCNHIKLVVPYTGESVSQTAKDALQVLLDSEKDDEERLHDQIEYYTATEIVRDLLAEKAYEPVDTDIRLQKSQKVEEPRTTYYGVARLVDLAQLHKDKGKALYERNIRYFLGSNNSDVNKSIKATLRDNPENFFYLNNGVTAVCDLVKPKGGKGGFKRFEVRGLSIINGAQTVASAAEFVQQNPNNNIDSAKVMLTLIKAPADGQFGIQVTKARNHQNIVQTANFASLDENQERLRQEIAYLGFDYHYRSEATIIQGNSIKLEEAIKALASLQPDPRYAVWLKSEPARFADSESVEYKTLFPDDLTGAVLVNAVLCYRNIRALAVSYEQSATSGSQEKLVYRHAIHVIIAIMMKRLRNRVNSVEVMDKVSLGGLISSPLDQLRQELIDFAIDPTTKRLMLALGPLAFFRKMETLTPFLISLMKKHFKLDNFKTTTNPEALSRLAAEKKSLEQDLADRLAKSAPQL